MNSALLVVILLTMLQGGNFEQSDLVYVYRHKNFPLINPTYCGKTDNALNFRISNGKEASFGQYPWIVQLFITSTTDTRPTFRAAGTIINKKYVITCAHIFAKKDIKKNRKYDVEVKTIRAAEYNTDTNPDCKDCPSYIDYNPEKVIVHEKFSFSDPKAYDIALIRVKEEMGLNLFVQPICLPLPSRNYTNDLYHYLGALEIAGWGGTNEIFREGGELVYNFSSIIRTTKVLVEKYTEKCYINESPRQDVICAGDFRAKEGPCIGDYGGPAMLYMDITEKSYYGLDLYNKARYFLAGVISYVDQPCGAVGRLSLYTRVDKFMPWILDNIEE